MLIGADFVYEWINRATSLTGHYTDDGVLPRALMPAVARRLALPIFRLSGSVTVQATLMIVACLFAAMLMVGYRTRLATIATWILHLAVIERLPSITGGGDNLMRYLLLWSMFVPLGACWSVDHWLSRRRGAASPPAGNGVGPPIVSLGVAALFVQLASIYFCAGVHKLEHPAWRQGVAVYRALQVYTRTTPLGDWMLNFPHFLSLTSLVLPVLQILGAVYLFVPFLMGQMRTLIVFSYAAFQITLGASIVLGNFQQVAVFMMVPFLPPWFWDHLLPKLGIGRLATISTGGAISRRRGLPGREVARGVSSEPARESSQRGPRRGAGCLPAHHESRRLSGQGGHSGPTGTAGLRPELRPELGSVFSA